MEVIREFAVDDCEEDRVVICRFAGRVGAVAEDETEGVGCLMPCAAFCHGVRAFFVVFVDEAGEFEGFGQVGGCETVAEEFGKGAAADGSVFVM